jgi:metal-dependent hydrolase (beta-lactamase superfamily II)
MKKSVFLITILLSTAFSTVHAQLQIREGTITNLYDAFGKNDSLTQDFGFSCILKYGGKTILFDAGSNADIFKDNVEKPGIDLRREQLQQLGGVLKNELGVVRVAPAHCTGHLAFRILKTLYGEDYLFSGLGETVSFEKK